MKVVYGSPIEKYYGGYTASLVILAGGLPNLQGGSEFSEGATAKRIFDVEIEKLRAQIFFYMPRRPKSCLAVREILNRSFETNIL
jgi:hypothetical protein